ncbi:hypothetical protein Pcinc_003988 [Petrolisthes cinctipes]|uniref:Uncharacterized protein n=1 Tax=Petrolisthes cinctipes TaxID=88211 RepID=A0AAE1GGP7_PETCI|nr:hypothetical protein Pcinc_003988 [Petrolisthes cinctipes]
MRRTYLKESELSVQKTLQLTYTYEGTKAQASQMKKREEEGTNLYKISTKYKQQQSNTWEKDRRQQEGDTTHKQARKCLGCTGSSHLHGQEKCPAYGIICNHCGVMNHFATACSKKRYSWKKRVNYLIGDNSSDDEDHVQHVSSKHSSNLDSDSYVFRVKTDTSLEE